MTLKVLWADDEPESMRFEHILAKNEGWIITFAHTVSKALEFIKNVSFDLVVVDLIMPDDEFQDKRGYANAESGTGLVRAIRDSSRVGFTKSDVPVLVITADHEAAVAVIRELPPPRYCINKPVDSDMYKKIIREITQQLEKTPEREN